MHADREEFIRQELRTPGAAAIAGVVFSVLLGISLVLVRLAVPGDPSRRQGVAGQLGA